jgi:hypothetical protein
MPRIFRKLRLAPVGKKLAAPQANQSAGRVDHNELVEIVLRQDSQRLEDWLFVNLTPIRPLGIRPVIQDRGGWHRRDG